LRDHWWVQLDDGGQWVDFDALDPIAGAGRALSQPSETMAARDIPPKLHHDVTIRVIAERWSGAAPKETRVFEFLARPADLFGESVVLQFWPGAWPSEIRRDVNGRFGLKATALEQTQWVAALTIAGQSVAQAIVSEAGDADKSPANPFSDIGKALDAPTSQTMTGRTTDALTAVWLEFEIRVPGQPAHTTRRVVFDLVGPARRSAGQAPNVPFSEAQRLERSFALMSRVEVLPVGFRIAPEFVAHLAAKSMATNRTLLRFAAAGDFSSAPEKVVEEAGHATPPPSPLYLLALTRLGSSASSDHVLVDRPNILMRHRYPAIVGNSLDVKAAFDVVINDVGVDLAIMDGFAQRVQQGVLDTNAEALLAGDRVPGNTADAFAGAHDWLAIQGATRSALAGLHVSDDVERRVAQDLDDGFLVIAPTTLGAMKDAKSVGWWRVDPRTGDTLGVGTNGWGMGPEDSALFNMAVSAASGFTFEYTLCQAFPQAMNLLKYLNEEYVGWQPRWAKAIKSKSAGQVLEENNTVCLLTAIASGIVATLPILLMVVKVRNMRRALGLAERVAAKEAEARALMQRVEGARPRGVDVKTQPWRSTGYDDTIAQLNATSKSSSAALLERQGIRDAMAARVDQCQKEATRSLRELLEYQRGRLLDPKYRPDVEAALEARVDLDCEKLTEAVADLRRVDPTLGFRGSGPAPPPLPKPAGNNNPTLDASPVVGAAGASNAVAK